MKRLINIFLGVLMLSVFLTACGSIESKIEGSWKVVMDDDIRAYLEIGEDRIVNRQESNDNPMTADYILTETQDDNFIIEVVNPETGTNEFFFEGYFENNDTVKLVDTPGDSEEKGKLIRVDSITEEMKKDKQREAAKKAAEEKKAKLAKKKEEEKKEKQRAKEKREEEKANQRAKEKREKETKQLAADASVKEKYLQKADELQDKIMRKLKEIDPNAQDMRPGFYGQYYGEWDDLLNEVWGVLKDTMPQDEFETLQSNQNEWIEKKEQHFDEMPDEAASARGRGMDYLAYETKDRTYYLIKDYMD